MLDSRQVEKTKVTPAATDVFFIVQGNPATPPEYVREGAECLAALIRRFCGGQVVYL